MLTGRACAVRPDLLPGDRQRRTRDPTQLALVQHRASTYPDQRKDRYEQHREQGDEGRRRVDIPSPRDVTVVAGDLTESSAIGSINLGSVTAAYMTAGNVHVERSPRFGCVH